MTTAQKLKLAVETLALYADPDSYRAMVFYSDPPCGEFWDDFSYCDTYKRKMPGKAARACLRKIASNKKPGHKPRPSLSAAGKGNQRRGIRH